MQVNPNPLPEYLPGEFNPCRVCPAGDQQYNLIRLPGPVSCKHQPTGEYYGRLPGYPDPDANRTSYPAVGIQYTRAGYILNSGTNTSHGGYISKGDNNPASDQGYLSVPGAAEIEPTQKDWVIGKAYFTIPLVGLLPLHIVEVIIVIVVIMVIHELYLRRKEKQAGETAEEVRKETAVTPRMAHHDIPSLLSHVLGGHRLTEPEALLLMTAQGRDVFRVAAAADEMRERRVGDVVTYVRNQNLHVTNICKNLCGFCGFGRNAGDEGAYCCDKVAIQAQARLAYERNVTEICLLSGVHPAFTLDTFVDLLHWIHEAAPGVHIHAFSPDEVAHVAEKNGCSTRDVLLRLKAEGLGTIQGTAAEILVDSVRKVICPKKVSPCRLGTDHQGVSRYRAPFDCDNHVRIVRNRTGPD